MIWQTTTSSHLRHFIALAHINRSRRYNNLLKYSKFLSSQVIWYFCSYQQLDMQARRIKGSLSWLKIQISEACSTAITTIFILIHYIAFD